MMNGGCATQGTGRCPSEGPPAGAEVDPSDGAEDVRGLVEEGEAEGEEVQPGGRAPLATARDGEWGNTEVIGR